MKENLRETAHARPRVGALSDAHNVPNFTSITRAFLSSAASKELGCPRCGAPLDFTNGMEWIGPDSFTCKHCSQLINIRLIQQALRDLGVK